MSRPFARSARTPAPIKQLVQLTRQLDFVRCFARAQAQRAGSEVLTGFAQGLALIHAHLSTPTTDLATLLGHDDAAIPPAALRWALLQDILPTFDDLYRCMRTLRSSPQSPLIWTDPSRDRQAGSVFFLFSDLCSLRAGAQGRGLACCVSTVFQSDIRGSAEAAA